MKTDTNNANRRNKKLTFKNKAPCRSFISKIKNIFIVIDNVEDLDIVMLMDNLLEYSENYSMTSRRLWNYYRDEVNDAANEIVAKNMKMKNNSKTTSKSFEYKTKIIGITPENNNRVDTEVAVPLKC